MRELEQPSRVRVWSCARCQFGSYTAIEPGEPEAAIIARIVATHDLFCPRSFCAGYLDAFSRPATGGNTHETT